MDSPQFAKPLTILVVDDEAPIRNTVADILKMEGMRAITAADGHAAIEQFRAQPVAINLVLLDLFMPGMDGVDVLRELRAIDANVQVILFSGYAEREISKLLNDNNIVAFLPKPFQIHQLLTQIQRVLQPLSESTRPE
ncbi:MAG: response regulator [Caldilineaceae bacterium]